MPWFIVIAIAVYSLLHLAVYLRLRPLLPAGRAWGLGLAVWFALMIGLLPLVFYLRGSGHIEVARIISWVAYTWMGWIFLAAISCLVAWPLQWLLGRLRRRSPGWTRPMAALCLCVTMAAAAYALYEAGDFRVTKLTLATPKLPATVQRVRVVLLTDMHLSLVNNAGWLKRVAALVAAQKPDVLVHAGDLLDRGLYDEARLTALLRAMPATLGKYAVTGNHEAFTGLEYSSNFIRQGGFTLLRGRAVMAAPYLRVVGFDDPRIAPPGDQAAFLAGLQPGPYTLVIKHRPLVQAGAAGHFDLQLSGHAHNGQLWPFTYITGLLFPLQGGLHRLAQGSLIYTSRGTGTWGPPMRLLAPPEITVIDLVPAKGATPRANERAPNG